MKIRHNPFARGIQDRAQLSITNGDSDYTDEDDDILPPILSSNPSSLLTSNIALPYLPLVPLPPPQQTSSKLLKYSKCFVFILVEFLRHQFQLCPTTTSNSQCFSDIQLYFSFQLFPTFQLYFNPQSVSTFLYISIKLYFNLHSAPSCSSSNTSFSILCTSCSFQSPPREQQRQQQCFRIWSDSELQFSCQTPSMVQLFPSNHHQLDADHQLYYNSQWPSSLLLTGVLALPISTDSSSGPPPTPLHRIFQDADLTSLHTLSKFSSSILPKDHHDTSSGVLQHQLPSKYAMNCSIVFH